MHIVQLFSSNDKNIILNNLICESNNFLKDSTKLVLKLLGYKDSHIKSNLFYVHLNYFLQKYIAKPEYENMKI